MSKLKDAMSMACGGGIVVVVWFWLGFGLGLVWFGSIWLVWWYVGGRRVLVGLICFVERREGGLGRREGGGGRERGGKGGRREWFWCDLKG